MKQHKRWPIVVVVLAILLALGAGLAYQKNEEHKAAVAAQLAAEQAAAEQAAKEEQAAREAAEKKAEEEAAAKKAAEEAAAAQKIKEAEEAEKAAAEAKANVQYGDRIGRVWVENTEVDCDLYWGDTASIFHAGAGCSADNGCVMPGEDGTVFVGGHTDSFFVDLKSAEIGDIIHLETLWGDYTYQVTEMKKITETDVEECRWGATEPSCILYTCYPFGIQTPTIYRWLVYADPVETGGPATF